MKKKKRFPSLGMRIIKSAVGVFLCFLVNFLRGGEGIVFYSNLAVLWCMQDYINETMAKAKQRTIGTVIGAGYGLVVLLCFRAMPEPGIKIAGGMDEEQLMLLLRGFVISIFVVVILYTTVVLKKQQASYFSCVVFLSIVVNHVGDLNPYLFVWNRFLDTMIGIVLGVLVNRASLPRKKHREILFVSGLDGTLLTLNGSLTAYSRVELNRMIEDGAQFTISTMRTPASLMEPLKDVNLKLPVIVMDGAALYNIQEMRYEHAYVFSPRHCRDIMAFFEMHQIPYFANAVVDDLLIIYYQDTEHEVYNTIVETLRKSPYRNYVKRPVSALENVVYFMLLDTTEHMEELYEEMVALDMDQRLKILKYNSEDYAGYTYIKIYNRNAAKENMIHYLQTMVEAEKTITYGTIPGRYTHVVEPGNANEVVKLMKQEYEPVKLGPWQLRS